MAYREETCETTLTVSHTHTLRQSVEHWQISGKLVNFLPSTHCICLYICYFCLYLSTYMHKFSFKIAVITCVRNSWEYTIALPLLWKILTGMYFLCKYVQEPEVIRVNLKFQQLNIATKLRLWQVVYWVNELLYPILIHMRDRLTVYLKLHTPR